MVVANRLSYDACALRELFVGIEYEKSFSHNYENTGTPASGRLPSMEKLPASTNTVEGVVEPCRPGPALDRPPRFLWDEVCEALHPPQFFLADFLHRYSTAKLLPADFRIKFL